MTAASRPPVPPESRIVGSHREDGWVKRNVLATVQYRCTDCGVWRYTCDLRAGRCIGCHRSHSSQRP